MKGIGKMMPEKVKVLNCTLIRTVIQENFHKVKLMEWVFTNGPTAKHTTGNGLADIKKETEYGREPTGTLMSVNGCNQRQKATEFTFGPQAINTRVSGKTV